MVGLELVVSDGIGPSNGCRGGVRQMGRWLWPARMFGAGACFRRPPTRRLAPIAAVLLLGSGCLGGQATVRYQPGDQGSKVEPLRWSFDADSPGGLPQGAIAFSGNWLIRAESDAASPPNALCQTATAEYPALSLSDAVYTDVVLSTRFKPISGRTDQAAGLIFRIQDKDNYYIRSSPGPATPHQPAAGHQLEGGGAGAWEAGPDDGGRCPVTQRIYAAVHSPSQLVAIDPTTDQVIGRYEIPGCQQPHGLYIAPSQQSAFVGCQKNAKLAVIDMGTMRVTSTHDVGRSPDVLAFDPSLRELYVAAEDGVLTVFTEDDAGVREIARGMAGPNAHSVAVDPDTHHIYLPLRDVGGQPVLREMVLETEGGR